MAIISIQASTPALGGQDRGNPSSLDVRVSGSFSANLPNGRYDAWCLNPFLPITMQRDYTSTTYEGHSSTGLQAIGLGHITQDQVDQLQWIIAQNFAGDPKYGGRYNFGEVQAAIWETIGYTDYLSHAGNAEFLSNNGLQTVDESDIASIRSLAAEAITRENSGEPSGNFFTMLIDPNGNVQPVILQLRTGKLGDFVWDDTNLDGLQNGNEAGVDGVTVRLLDAQGNILMTTVTGDDASTATVEHGFYQFTGLKAGDYRVQFVKPEEFTAFTRANAQSNDQDAQDSDAGDNGLTHLVTLGNGETNNTIDAGLVCNAALGDRVWLDVDGNGQQDDGERGVSDVRVVLCDTDGNPTGRTATTDAQGDYLFTGLVPGTYSVRFELPSGFEFTRRDGAIDTLDSDADTFTGKTANYTLDSGETNLSVDAGLVQRARLGDRVWEDADANGQQDEGEQGIANVAVHLRDADGNIVASTTTDVNGLYGFDVLPGTYAVSIEKPAGFLVSPRNVGADDIDSDIDAGTLTTPSVTLQSGDTNLTLDAGLYRNAQLGDRVWLDTDGDGRQDDGEAGMAGVRVLLCDAAGNPTGRTATTDTLGNYLFNDLMPGTYSVRFELPQGYEFTRRNASLDERDSDADALTGITTNYTLTSGENNLTVDAGLVQRARLGDRVWEDTDADGRQDNGELGIANVAVHLRDADGNIVASTTTDVNGLYGFDVLPGTYAVSIEKPAGFLVSPHNVGADDLDSDIDAGTLTTPSVTLQSGDTNLTLDAGLYRKAQLGDRVWLDTDGDGRQDDGEAGLAGVRILLCDATGNPTGRTATSDAQGNYLYNDLVPGTYSVRFELPLGYEFTRRNASLDERDSDADALTGKTANYTLTSGENNLTVDAGLVQRAHLGDRVWEDTDADGRQDNGELGIANVAVHLRDADGNIVASTTTDINGLYGFDVLPGTYTVSIEKPAGFLVSPRNVGADDLDSDIDTGTLSTPTVTLQSGETNLTLDAGLYRNAQLGDRVWLDTDGDGRQDDGEAGMAGVRVLLCDSTGNPTGRTATTDALGNYLFSDLMPGTYSVRFELADGYAFTRRNASTDNLDSDADRLTGKTSNYVLSSGESELTVDAGIVRHAHLGDRVWNDTDADGHQDDGEQGIAQVKVHLRDLDGNIIASTTTDQNGLYGFDVLPGTYAVSIEKPAGFIVSFRDATNDALDSDIDAGTLTTPLVTLQSGETNLTLDAGLYRNAQLGDRVWLDKDGDGRQDDGEAGVAGVRVLLCDAAGNPTGRTATTDAEGNYLFNDLMPGTYSVRFELPDGYVFTRRDTGTDNLDSDADRLTGKTGNYVLSSGESELTVDAGIVRHARLGDRVWNDTDADGHQDDGEQGIAQVKVHLRDLNGDIIASTTTGQNGLYGFDVLPGTYSVSIEKPAGYRVSPRNNNADDADSDIDAVTLTTQQVTLHSGDVNLTLDAGLYKAAAIGDRVWHDRDGDGLQDEGEMGIADVTVHLRNGIGVILATRTTDANGNYLFDDLRPGTYSLQFVAPEGYEFTRRNIGDETLDSDANRATGTTADTVLTAGETDLSWDAGLYLPARLGDRVWEDTDADGIQDSGEQGIEGVTVHLRNAAGSMVRSTTTDAQGYYHFDVPPGTWSVSVAPPAGHFISRKDAGSDDALDSDIDAVTRTTAAVTLASGEQNLTLDAGLYRKATLGDRVWHDRDGNGLQDEGETGVAGVRVLLCDAAGNPTGRTATTDALGNYLFSDLVPGTYSVKFEAPTGYSFTRSDSSADGIDSDADTLSSKTGNYTLASGERNLSVDAGLVQRARLGDRIWEDTDADGIQDDGERGIANVRVHLRDANGQIIASTSTDLNGLYGFEVAPGTWSISIEKPAGYHLSPRNAGQDDARDSDIDPVTLASHQVTLNSGDVNLTLDGGLYRKASIGDRVWVDRDHDNLQDANESGVGKVKVSLQNVSGTTLMTTMTDSNGYYLFADLDPGLYRIVFDKTDTRFGGVDLSTWRWTKADIGTDDQIDGDANSTTDVAVTAYTTLESGEIDRSWDVGVTPLIIDLNGDGVRTVARTDSEATFDLLGNGSAIRSGWVSAQDGLLAVDRNGNGNIDSIHELFGGLAQGDGFARLRTYDSNHDGWVDMSDSAFAELRVWQDANGNHATDAGELRTLAEAGIAALKTAFVAIPELDAQGNLHLERGSAMLSDGRNADMTDVYFSVDSEVAAGAGLQLASLASLLGDDTSVDALLASHDRPHPGSPVSPGCPGTPGLPPQAAATPADSFDNEVIRALMRDNSYVMDGA